jgi:peptide/nickel transport system substrate-binding protein
VIVVVAAEPPGFDGHREETFAMLHRVGPHYNTLLRVDPFDRTGTKFIGDLASPWNWIYKADILAKDPHWYEKNVMGTGPFTFVEYARGSHGIGKKNPDYWDKGKPYLDGYRAIFIQDAGAQVAAIRGERAMIRFRGFTPAQRDTLVTALGSKITVQEST